MSRSARCPACKGSVPAGAFQCPECELLLSDLSEEIESTVGDGRVLPAFFERPRASAVRPRAAKSSTHERPRSGPLPHVETRPRMLRLQLSNLGLSRIEAAVAGMCDGALSVREIAVAVRMPVREVQGLLHGLAGLGLVALPPPPPVPDEAGVQCDDDEALPTVRFDLNQLNQRVERHRESVQQARANPAPPPPARTQSKASLARGKAGGGQNPLEQAIKLERNGRGLEALRYLELAVSRSPDAAPLYNRLAIVLIRERFDFRAAERMLLKALELEPGNPVYKANLLAVRERKPIATHPIPSRPRG